MDLSRLHPQARSALSAQRRVPLTVENLPGVRRSMADAAPEEVGAGPAVREVTDVDAGGVRARFYRDRDDAPVLLYAHGGGWVMGDLATHDGLCRQIVHDSGWSVLAVDYRLAPEHPYPAALEDVERALAWLPAGPVAVGGDSAGGWLAVMAARRATRPIAAQVLICPALDPAMAYPDLDDFGLHRDEMRFFWEAFAPGGLEAAADPMRMDVTGMPPAIVITAELDVLRDEGERYAARLQDAEVPVTAVRHLGVNHNFARKLAIFDAARVAIAEIATVLGSVLRSTTSAP
ncbi:alpha/beta hydrolase [Actinoplanes sp. NPDC051633]|uniref:alpha/beta hydrolase n=1 Tax=Actinoplanes sp. NPDC051633 TaxID=3155670 RepID=UPI00342E015B